MNEINVTCCKKCPYYCCYNDKFTWLEYCIYPNKSAGDLWDIDTKKERHPDCPATSVVINFI